MSLDPNVRPQIIEDRDAWFGYFHRWLARASLVKVSAEDLAWIWPGATEAAGRRRAADRGRRRRPGHPRPRRCGRAPSHGFVSVPAPDVEVVDTVGAGDAFCGGLLAHLWQRGVTDRAALDAARRRRVAGAVSFAVTVAGMTCARAGADPPWAAMLVGELRDRAACTSCSPPPSWRPSPRSVGSAVAAAGLVRALRDLGVEVTVVLPDYGGAALVETTRSSRSTCPRGPVRRWPGAARSTGSGPSRSSGRTACVRSHPYLQPDGTGWPDNDRRFFAFSTAVAALAALEQPDVLHLNDWHTAATLAFLGPPAADRAHHPQPGLPGPHQPGLARRLPALHRDAYRPRAATATRSSAASGWPTSWSRSARPTRRRSSPRPRGMGIARRAAGPGRSPRRHPQRDRHRRVGPGQRPAPAGRLRLADLARQGRSPPSGAGRDGPAGPAAVRWWSWCRGSSSRRAWTCSLPVLDLLRPAAGPAGRAGRRRRGAGRGAGRGRRAPARTGRVPARVRRPPGPPAVRRRRPAGHAEPVRAVRPRPDAGDALRHAAGRDRRRRPARHRGRHRRPASATAPGLVAQVRQLAGAARRAPPGCPGPRRHRARRKAMQRRGHDRGLVVGRAGPPSTSSSTSRSSPTRGSPP